MKQHSPKAQLRRDLYRLLGSMDFVSRHPALKRDTAESQRLAEIYQQLGLAWEFLALQCPSCCNSTNATASPGW